jgi:voltage-gated potassium channel
LLRLAAKIWKQTGGRPAAKIGLVITLLAFMSACGLHVFERASVSASDAAAGIETPYATFGGTLRSVVVLLMSGFDVYPPKTMPGWVCASFTMALGIALVALLTADLASHLVQLTLRSGGQKQISVKDHYVICGWHTKDTFLIETLTSDTLPALHHVVIVDENLDAPPVHDPYVHLVRGDPTEERVLDLANVKEAHTALIPLDWGMSTHSLRDSRNTLIMLAVEARARGVYTCVGVAKPDSKKHLGRTQADEIICSGQISQRVLTQAALTHGVSLFLSDILGTQQRCQVHKVRLPEALAHLDFRELFLLLNQELEEIVLAVEREGKIYSNPTGRFLLEPGDALFLLGYSSEDDLRRLAEAERQRHVKPPAGRIDRSGTRDETEPAREGPPETN